jgi:hypothetical protein
MIMHPDHASRLARWCWRSRPIAWSAWRWLAAAGAKGDLVARAEVVRIATQESAYHPRQAAAGAAIAAWWTRERGLDLRKLVVRNRFLADTHPERWMTAALHGRLLDLWEPGVAVAVPNLLADADPAVRRGAEVACERAAEPELGELWREVDTQRGLDALTRNENEPTPATLATASLQWAGAPADRLLAAVMEVHTSEHLRPALARACRERDLVPTDPVQRVSFFLLTGQSERCRAADPDGALLGVAYRGASEAARSRLRAALITSGDLDVIRMLTDGASVSSAESADVVRVLAERGDWPELWRVVPALPVAEAVAATRLFNGWRPADEPGRVLFERLARTDPDQLTTAIADKSYTLHLRLDDGATVEGCAVSSDGSRLAVAAGHDALIDYELPSGRIVATHPQPWLRFPDPDPPYFLVHIGKAIIARKERSRLLLVVSRGGQEFWGEPPYSPVGLAPTREGFVVMTTSTSTDAELMFIGSNGHWIRSAHPLHRLGLHPHDLALGALATQPDTGLIAIGGRELIVLAADCRRVIARVAMEAKLREVVFTGPKSIVTVDRYHMLTSWRLTGRTLIRESKAQLPAARNLTACPRHGIVAVLVAGELRFVDATTLEPAAPPVDPRRNWSRSRLWCSPSGEHLVFVPEDGRGLDVHFEADGPPDPIVALARRPLGEATPADLATVEKAIAQDDTEHRELLGLLHACLRHRFRNEIALGSCRPVGDQHDIGIVGTKEPT